MTIRSTTFECPWCGPNGVEVDRTLPVHLRLCDDCGSALYAPERPPQGKPASETVISLRTILRKHLQDWHQTRWPGMEWGKAILGNSILGALAVHGCDPQIELQAAIADVEFAEFTKPYGW